METNKEKVEISNPDNEGVRTYSINKNNMYSKAPYKGVIIFAIIVFAIVIMTVSCNKLVGDLLTASPTTTNKIQELPESPYVATLYVEGAISSSNYDYFGSPFGYQHEWTLDQIEEMKNDKNNRGLIIFVDSPGGGVYESDELYLKIKEYQEETSRPVYAYFGSVAASGGYYISAPADMIIANRNCWTGSIGVTIGTLFDFTQLLENYGIKSETITSGANKAMGSNFDELTEEQRVIFQTLVDEAYYQFAGIVSKEREINMETVMKIADGRIYTANQALENNLIDEIATFDEAKQQMLEEYDLEDATIIDVKYTDNTLLGSLLGNINIKGMKSKGDLDMLMRIVGEDEGFTVSYMCEALK